MQNKPVLYTVQPVVLINPYLNNQGLVQQTQGLVQQTQLNFSPLVPSSPPSYMNTHTHQVVISNENSTIKPIPMWRTGLCDCCADTKICIMGCFFPCCLHGTNAMKLNDSSCIGNCLCYLCCPCCQTSILRRDIRYKYNLPDTNDCCVSWFCHPCALCQDAREIKFRTSSPTQQTMV